MKLEALGRKQLVTADESTSGTRLVPRFYRGSVACEHSTADTARE